MDTRDEPTRALHRRTPPANGTPRRGIAVPLWLVTIIAVVGIGTGFGAGYLAKGKTADTGSQVAIQQATGQAVPQQNASAAQGAAHIGDKIPLHGPNGENITIGLVSITDPAAAVHTQPQPGQRYISALLRLENHGTTAWNGNGAPTVGSHIIDTRGQTYGPVAATTTVGQMYSSHVVIEPGQSALGTVTFSVPDGVQPNAIQIALDDGAGPTAQWRIN